MDFTFNPGRKPIQRILKARMSIETTRIIDIDLVRNLNEFCSSTNTGISQCFTTKEPQTEMQARKAEKIIV